MTDRRRMVVQVSVVVQDNDRVLLVQEGDPSAGRRWNLPGGHLEMGEAIQDCAKRELFEETALKACSLRVLGVYPALRSESVYAIRFVFLANVENLHEAAAGDEIAAIRWSTPDEIKEMPDTALIAPEVFRQVMRDVAGGVSYSSELIAEPMAGDQSWLAGKSGC